VAGRTIGALVLAGVLVVGAFSGAPAPLAFEVASIKPSDPVSAIGLRRLPGGRFSTSNASLRLLITWAYDIGDERLTGAPGWLDSARFDIAAKAPNENPTLDELHAMMQSLLAERFKLRVHTETRELPMYMLITDRGGPKVHVLDAATAFNHDPFKMTESGRLSGTSVTAAMLAKVLTGQLGHYVRDSTEFKSPFDFTLEWRPDSAAADDTRADLFTAIREQLGFRLNPGRAPVDVVAIDHIENHPTDN
jgi:uncharacterized protein (TIGR03435 family)